MRVFDVQRALFSLIFGLFFLVTFNAAQAQAEPTRVLFWDANLDSNYSKTRHRQRMVRFLNEYENGARYSVDYEFKTRGGAFASYLGSQAPYKIIIVAASNPNRPFNQTDLQAFQNFYSSSGSALMLDGTLFIRNNDFKSRTKWPGTNESSAKLLINQLEALRDAGGGILVGTDHGRFQNAANQVVRALVPEARFSQTTNPSRNGEFIGEVLVAGKESIKPLDVLRHWEAIPNQGQAPVGQFTDFTGRPVTLHTLVEAANKGGSKRRPYISFSVDPGEKRFDIASDDAPIVDRMPTRKSLPKN